MYGVGDKVFLTEEYDRLYNRLNVGKEVEIISIDRGDTFLPICIRTKSSRIYWIGNESIKSKNDLLGIKV